MRVSVGNLLMLACVAALPGSPDSGWLLRPLRSLGSARCIFVDLGANVGDSMENFLLGQPTKERFSGKGDGSGTVYRDPSTGGLRRYHHFVGEAGFPIDSLRCKRDAQPGWCRCPHQPNRTNVDAYAVEANPAFAASLEAICFTLARIFLACTRRRPFPITPTLRV